MLVERHGPDVGHRPLGDDEAFLHQLGQAVRVRRDHDMRLAGPERRLACRDVGHHQDDEAVDERAPLLLPVVVEALEHHEVARHALHELERAGADHVRLNAVVPVLLDRFGADDAHGPAVGLREHPQERIERVREMEVHGEVVHRLDVIEAGDVPPPSGRRRRRLVEVGGVLAAHGGLIELPVDVEHHVIGGEVGAVVELHALLEMEGVDLAVLGHLPGLRQPRNERRRDARLVEHVLLHQGLGDVIHHPARAAGGAGDVGIELAQLGLVRGDQRAALPGLLRHGDSRQSDGRNGAERRCA